MTTKITVSLPDEQVAALREAVRAGAARSVSALVSKALADRLQQETLDEVLAHLERVHGPVPQADRDGPATRSATHDRSDAGQAGALLGLEKGSVRVRGLLEEATRPRAVRIPAAVLVQVWRSGARQAVLSRLLSSEGTEVVALDQAGAQAVGGLLAATGMRDVVDASVVVCAWSHDDTVVTSDPDDLRRLDPTLRLVAL